VAEPERTAGIVLAGGASKRMGSPKAALEWHGSTLVRRAAGLVARAVGGPVVVVRAAGLELPALPAAVEVVKDAQPGRGPLQGIAAGLQRIGDRADVVYVAGVDTPLLHPAFIALIVRSLRPGDDVALPRAQGFGQHLAAAYRISKLAHPLGEQLDHDRLGAGELIARLRTRELDETALLADPRVAALDPRLDSLLNLNTPGDYEAARARPAPRVTVRASASASASAEPSTVEAATLAAAAKAAGITHGSPLTAVLEGHGPICDPHEPLASGDALTFAMS
jgi:molybdopterin-guanine dinucleotide biosynthesis protein A